MRSSSSRPMLPMTITSSHLSILPTKSSSSPRIAMGSHRSRALSGALRGLDVMHLRTHGREGRLFPGGTEVNAVSMRNEHRVRLERIRDAFSNDADFPINGCDFTSGEEGLEAAEQWSARRSRTTTTSPMAKRPAQSWRQASPAATAGVSRSRLCRARRHQSRRRCLKRPRTAVARAAQRRRRAPQRGEIPH